MNFASILRSSSRVRSTFDEMPIHSRWWRLVLCLHGKPVRQKTGTLEAKQTIAAGLRFYARLYLGVAVLMLLAAVTVTFFAFSDLILEIILLVVSSIYLACTSELALKGARGYIENPIRAAPVLVVFFVSIIAYLCCFCGFCLAILRFTFPQNEWWLLVATGVLLLFGVGSYMIEVIYFLSPDDQ